MDGYYKLAPFGSPGEKSLRTEGELLASLDHPHIVKGANRSESGWEILKVNTIEGQPLTKVRDTLSTQTKMQILEEVESALRYINNKGILHADVCSENILWTGKESCLIDFEEAVLAAPLKATDSPDFIGGPPCCWGDNGYGYNTYLCFASLREWLLMPEFLSLKGEISAKGEWNPHSPGNTCEPWSTPDNGSVYQTIAFGNVSVKGQRDPDLRFRYLGTSKQVCFENTRVLDIGCNFGRLGAFLNQFGILQYVGLDLSAGYIDVAGRIAELEGRKNSQFLVGDICDVEIKDRLAELAPRGYDVVICQSVYHHIDNKKRFWEHVARLNTRSVIFENPINDGRYLLTNSWSEEKEYLRSIGYAMKWESYDNDYSSRVLAVFERS